MNGIDLSDDWWRRIRGPTEAARGLPNEAYCSEAVFELEQRRLFSTTWCFAGRASAIPGEGDLRAMEVAGLPLFMVRDADHSIRAFHNVCPHRGARLVREDEPSRRNIVCPYHAWTYNLDGKLKRRPHFSGPGCHDDAEDASAQPVTLFPVRTVQWFDWVFVDLSGEAADFADHFEPLTRRIEDFPLDAFVYGNTIRCEFEANWKLVAENFFDVYHIFKVHPELDKIYGGPRTSNHTDGVLIYNEYFANAQGRGHGLPQPQGLSPEWENRVFFANLYPNLGFGAYPSNVYLTEFVPLSATRTAMEMHFYFVDEPQLRAQSKAQQEILYEFWTKLNAEDEGICALLQLGRRSPAYPGGQLSPHWDRATQYFAKRIAEALSE